jgi:FAD/FMN-containing dehydrogenase
MPNRLRVSLDRAIRGAVITEELELDRLRRDESHVRGEALAAVQPADVDDVVDLVRWARRHRVALVPRGAGSSLNGESATLRGGVVVDFSPWNEMGEIEAGSRTVQVGPGVVNLDLQVALRPYGLFYPPNPGSWATSTIGGNVATNAWGPRSYAYGSTRRWVREVEAVLGTGERVRLGSRAEKRSAGPDLLQMFVGSEGTLGMATALTLRLAPIPEIRQGWAVPLPPRAPLGQIAMALSRTTGTGLSAVEYLDRTSAEGLQLRRGARWPPDSALLLLELEASDRADARHRTTRVRSALRAAGVTAEPSIFDDADRLWTLRGEASRVLDEEYGPRVREDVAVPLARVDELVATVRKIAREEEVRLFLFGHLGEGSLHPNYGVDPGSPSGNRIRAAVCTAALALGGTISGEHGIGRLKREFLERELGAAALRVVREVRRACDPDGILNPGKLYPEATPTTAPLSRSPSVEASGRTGTASPTGARRRGGVSKANLRRRVRSP